jgi:hypothetical protein
VTQFQSHTTENITENRRKAQPELAENLDPESGDILHSRSKTCIHGQRDTNVHH